MGVDTKGYVHTKVKDVMHVVMLVERAISRLVRAKMAGEKKIRFQMPEGFMLPTTRLIARSGATSTTFSIAGENRDLHMFFSCDCDQNDLYPGAKIIFSLGLWGMSDEIMTAVLSELTHLGHCYLDHNDGDDVPNVKILAPSRRFVDMVMDGSDSALSFNNYVNMHALVAPDKPLHKFLGLTAAETKSCLTTSDSVFEICQRYEDTAKVEMGLGLAMQTLLKATA